MRFVYSVIRFVPDPARGEFVNVGAIVGSEESSEWTMRHVDNAVRARAVDDHKALTAVWSFFDSVGRAIDAFEQATEGLFPEAVTDELSEDWLERLHHDHRNIVQLSPPVPMKASSAEEALEKVFEIFVVDPAQRRFPFQKKYAALVAVRAAYGRHLIRKGLNYRERVPLRTPNFKEQFDFAVCNGSVLQLTQTWSFQVPDQDALAQQVRAWGWAVHDLQREGGEVFLSGAQQLLVPKNVDVEVVFVPPASGQDARAMEEATSVFDELGVQAVPADAADRVGERARELLVRSGVQLDIGPGA